MAKQKEFDVGKQIPGFKPGQTPYVVGPDLPVGIAGLKAHITIEKITTKGTKRVITKFHISFLGTNPQAGATWEWSSSSYAFKGWFKADSLAGKIAADKEAQFLTAVNTFVNNYETKFTDSSGSIAAPTKPTIR